MSEVFFFFVAGGGGGWGGGGGGGGVGAKACYPGKIRVLVTIRYRKVDLKLTNSVLKRKQKWC